MPLSWRPCRFPNFLADEFIASSTRCRASVASSLTGAVLQDFVWLVFFVFTSEAYALDALTFSCSLGKVVHVPVVVTTGAWLRQCMKLWSVRSCSALAVL